MLENIDKKTPNILVIGDLMVDNYLWGSSKRISPEAPVPIVNITNETYVLGGAGNVVKNLKSLGANVDIIGVIGNCKVSSKIRALLKQIKINTDYLVIENNRESSIKSRVIASGQQVIRFDRETIDYISRETQEEIVRLFISLIDSYDSVLLSDYGKGVLTKDLCQSIISKSNERKIKVLVDPKGSDFSKYSNAFLLTPNLAEAMVVVKQQISPDNSESLNEALLKLKKEFSVTVPLITLSENGICFLNRNFNLISTKAKEVFDVTGAGDTVLAALGFYLSNSEDINKAVEFANTAAGIVVGKVGSACVTINEIKKAYCGLDSSIKNINEIKLIVENLKKINKSIVFTNGCFDIVHKGHVDYLQKAKEYGDVLIVGINSDDSVKNLKGEERPIINQSSRSSVIAAMQAVDYVVIFNETTPLNLIKLIKPNVLIKGSDYKKSEIIGTEYSDNTQVVELTEGYSSSKIIKKIREL